MSYYFAEEVRVDYNALSSLFRIEHSMQKQERKSLSAVVSEVSTPPLIFSSYHNNATLLDCLNTHLQVPSIHNFHHNFNYVVFINSII